MNLRRYDDAAVLSFGNHLRNRFENGELNWIELAQALSDLKFRDGAGDYWFLDACAGRWYRLDQTEWRAMPEPAGVLEGLASLPIGEAAVPGEPQPDTDLGEDWAEGSSVTALEEVTRMVRSAYAAGDLSSLDAAALLKQHYLVDRWGRFWAVGVKSGRWYRSEGEVWTEAGASPPVDSLLTLEMPGTCPACGAETGGGDICAACGAGIAPVLSEVSDEAYTGIFDFLLRGGSVPEAVTEPWDPPAGFPEGVAEGVDVRDAETIRRCGACGTINASDRSFCRQCGVSLTVVDCLACGTRMEAGKRFCTQCGATLGQGNRYG